MSEYKRLTDDDCYYCEMECRDCSSSNGIKTLDGCPEKRRYEELRKYERIGNPDEFAELAQAKAEGRLVVLPKPEESDYPGLKGKYHVFKAKDNTPIEDCFVLRPEKDPAAVNALIAYAKTTKNKQLAKDILYWIGDNGKVVVLPCKVGDKIYTIPDYAYSGFKYWEVFSIEIFPGDIIFRLGHSGTTDYSSFALSDWGIRAFSSKEEAEAALEQNGGEHEQTNTP